MKSVVEAHWDDLPESMRLEVIESQPSQSDMLHFAALELGLDIGVPGGNVSRDTLATFLLAAIEQVDTDTGDNGDGGRERGVDTDGNDHADGDVDINDEADTVVYRSPSHLGDRIYHSEIDCPSLQRDDIDQEDILEKSISVLGTFRRCGHCWSDSAADPSDVSDTDVSDDPEAGDRPESQPGNREVCPDCGESFAGSRGLGVHQSASDCGEVEDSDADGSSTDPDVRTCEHCGDEFHKNGIGPHKANCPDKDDESTEIADSESDADPAQVDADSDADTNADSGIEADADDEPDERFECKCGAEFDSKSGFNGHVGHCNEHDVVRICSTCGAEFDNCLEYRIHRTEEHDVPQGKLNYLQPGEFEALVEDADSVTELAEECGFQTDRVLRMLSIYGLSGAVGDPNWSVQDAHKDTFRDVEVKYSTTSGSGEAET